MMQTAKPYIQPEHMPFAPGQGFYIAVVVCLALVVIYLWRIRRMAFIIAKNQVETGILLNLILKELRKKNDS